MVVELDVVEVVDEIVEMADVVVITDDGIVEDLAGANVVEAEDRLVVELVIVEADAEVRTVVGVVVIEIVVD